MPAARRALAAAILSAGAAAAAPPAWRVNPADFELAGSLTAQVVVDGEPLAEPGSLVAAFAGEALRGVAGPLEVLGRWLYFVTLYADTPGDTLTFRLYSAAADTVVDLDGTVVFEAATPRGSPAVPFVLRGSVPVPTVVGAAAAAPTPSSSALVLDDAYPNPFNATLRLRWAGAGGGPVEVVVFDALGRPVRRLAASGRGAGGASVTWDGRDDAGRLVASGVYAYVVRAGGRRAQGRVTLVR